MDVSITPLDHGTFAKLLDFSADCGCDAFVVHRPRTQDTSGHQRLPDAILESIRPFWASGSPGSPRYCFTGFLNSESRPILLALARNELASSPLRVNFGQLRSITQGQLCSVSPSSGCADLALSDLQAEALFKRGMMFRFRTSPEGHWRPFSSEHVLINAPDDIPLGADAFDSDRWQNWGISAKDNALRIANDPLILRWWTPAHDELLEREIARLGWAWQPPYRELAAITPHAVIDDFKTNHPKCKSGSWYGVLSYFAYSRAVDIGLTERMKARPIWVRCLLCGRLLHQSRSYLLAAADQSFFCYPCIRETWWSAPRDLPPEDTKDYVGRIAELIGRVPRATFGKARSDFFGLPPERLAKVLRAFKGRPTDSAVRTHFGSWFGALVASGVLPAGTEQGMRGIRSIAMDGHLCLSLGERTICDFFHRHAIVHEREPQYPGDRGFRADWLVGEYFIEYLGLSGEADYDERTKQKELMLSCHGRKLIKIFPKDLADGAFVRKLVPVLPAEALAVEMEGLPRP